MLAAMTDTDKDKPEVIEERMRDALKRALHTPPKPHGNEKKQPEKEKPSG